MGRHRSGSVTTRGLLWIAAAALMVLASVAAVLAVFDRPSPGPGDGDRSLLTAPDCARTLRVVTAASFAPVLDGVRPVLAEGPDCIALDAVVVDGRAAADRVAEREADVWIPDDASWAAAARPGLLAEEGTGGAGTVLATSPIYMVTDEATAGRVRAAGGTWRGLAGLVTAGTGVRLAVRDPNGSGDGMVAAGSLAEAVWLAEGMDASSAALSAALRWTRTVGGPRPALPERDGEVGLVPEYELFGRTPAAVLTGSDHTALLRYAWLPSATATQMPERAAALDSLLAALKDARAADAYAAAHLRRPDGAAPPDAPGWLPPLAAEPLKMLGRHHVDHVFAAWYVQDRRSSILLAVDVSGSMAEPAPGTATPLIDLVRQGCLAVGRLLPDQSSLGLWAFGSRLDPPRDHRVLLPTAPLSDGQRAGLAGAAAQLAAQATGTGLYDTVLAAYRSATASYRPGMGNQVVVFTDGRNEDDSDTITAEQLSSGLRAAADPARRVELTVVAFGDLPEVEVLAKALEPIDGYVSDVRTPQEVAAAFLHAAASGVHA